MAFFLFTVASAVGAWVYFDGPGKPGTKRKELLRTRSIPLVRDGTSCPVIPLNSPLIGEGSITFRTRTKRDLGNALTKVFDDASKNLASEDQKKFLLKTQDRALLFMTKEDVETKRGEIVAAMCDRILAQANQEKFEAKTARIFGTFRGSTENPQGRKRQAFAAQKRRFLSFSGKRFGFGQIAGHCRGLGSDGRQQRSHEGAF